MIDLNKIKAAVMGSRDGITISDSSLPDNPLIFVNPAYEEMTGYSFEESAGRNCRYLQSPDVDQEDQLDIIRKAIKNRQECLVVLKNYRKDGSMFWNELSLSPILNDTGEPSYFLGIQRDVTNQVIMQEAIIGKNDELAFQKFALDEHAIVSIANVAGNITYVNDKFCTISGYDREELLGKNHKIVKSDEHSDAFFVDMWKTISSGCSWHGEIKNINKNGSHYWVKTTIVPTLNDVGKPYQYVGIRTEITERKHAEEKLKHYTSHDILTDLPNRALLIGHLSHAMVKCIQYDLSLIVAYIDLDDFKTVNRVYGHHIGDQLLAAISKRMQMVLGEADILSRAGSNEFIAVITDLENMDDSELILGRLLKVVSEPVILSEASIQVSASIGFTCYPQNKVYEEQLIRHAYQAMHIAKQAGKDRYQLFDAEQDNIVKSQRKKISDVHSAMDRNEFVLHYQPKVNMRTGEVIGVEALIRWQHPVKGLVPPLDFLPAIEGHPISVVLGEWVIDTALNQIDQWRNLGINLAISVNISAYQLTQKNFPDRLSALLIAHPEVNPSSLELEILETSALSDISQVSCIMKACNDLGVSFALDDFGTGYSSLTYLRRLPAHLVKIDQSFVRDMLEDPDDLAIVKGIIGLAKAFQREVIAEGVETLAHGQALLQLGCQLAQGYGIARPMPADDIPEWICSWKADDAWRAVDFI